MFLKRSIILLISLILIVLSACSNNSSNTNSEVNEKAKDGSSNEKIELRISWWGSVDRAKKYEEMFDLYEKQNPNVTIVTETAGFGDYFNKLATQAAGGNPPDIFSLHMLLYGSQYADFNILEPLDPYVKSGVIKLDDWDKSVVDAGKIKGDLYALSKGVTLASVLVNEDWIKELGLELPKNPMSYEELKEFGLKAKKVLGKDQYVINDASTQWDHGLETYIRQKGRSFLSEDGKKLGFTKEDLKEWLSYWEELRELGIVPPAEASAEEGGQSIQENTFLVQKKSLMYTTNSNQANQFQNYMDDKLGLYRWPILPDGKFKGGENLQASSFVISKKSKHKDEAAKLLNWFVNDLEAQKVFKAELGVPSSAAVKEAIVGDLSPLEAASFKHMEEVGKDIPPTDTRPSGSVEIHELLKNYRDKNAFGQLTVDEAVDAVFKEAEKILK